MRQSRMMSLVEAIANVAVGYGVAVATQALVFPLFGIGASFAQNLGIGAIFTGVSRARSYALRRLFEAFRFGRSGCPVAHPLSQAMPSPSRSRP